MKWVRRVIVATLLLGIVGAVVWSFIPHPVPVDLALVEQGVFVATVDADGRTRVKETYVVAAPLTASLERIEVHPGDAVVAGTVVARLRPTEPPLLDPQARAAARARIGAARAAVKQAEAAAGRARAAREHAETELARAERLAAKGASTDVALQQARMEARARLRESESARFGVDVAANEVSLAEAALQRIGRPPGPDEIVEVRSPVGGRVLRVLHESAGPVAAGTSLLEIADPGALEIIVDVATADAVSIRPGAAVSIERWGGAAPLAAHVRLVEPAAFTRLSALGIEEQRVNVVADLEDPPERWASLGDGYRVEARITVWRGEDVVHVPSSALFREGGAWAVYVRSNGRASLRTVQPGHRSGVRVEITSGLVAGDTIILHPGDAVADKVRVARR